MSRDDPGPQLSDLQLAIMKVLWELGEAPVAQVQEALAAERPLAPTTVATMLKRMERRGLVAHRTSGRTFHYRPRVTEEQVLRSDLEDLTQRWFDGDPTALVSHLLGAHEISRGDLEKVRRLIAGSTPHKRRRRRHDK